MKALFASSLLLTLTQPAFALSDGQYLKTDGFACANAEHDLVASKDSTLAFSTGEGLHDITSIHVLDADDNHIEIRGTFVTWHRAARGKFTATFTQGQLVDLKAEGHAELAWGPHWPDKNFAGEFVYHWKKGTAKPEIVTTGTLTHPEAWHLLDARTITNLRTVVSRNEILLIYPYYSGNHNCAANPRIAKVEIEPLTFQIPKVDWSQADLITEGEGALLPSQLSYDPDIRFIKVVEPSESVLVAR